MINPEDVAASFAEHRSRVEAAAARVLHDRDEAADVASEAFLTLLERGPDDQRLILPWLLTTARNRALNAVRGRRRSQARLPMLVEQHIPPPSPAADQQVGAFVRALLARLQPRDRDALMLRFRDEAGYEQIAGSLGTTVGQARVVVHRAIGRLRREAVTMLAERHGAPAACARALSRAAGRARLQRHDGCGPCTAVLDEVAGLGAPAMIAVSPGLLHAIAERAARIGARLRPPRTPGAERIAEAVTALALAGAVGVGGGAAAAVPPPTDVAAARAAASSMDAAALSPLTLAAATTPQGPREISVTGIDDPEEPDRLAMHHHPLLERVRAILDPIEARSEPSDLRRFEVASLAGADGRHLGIRFRLDLAGDVHDEMSFDVHWLYDDAVGCRGSIFIDASEETFTTTCPGGTWVVSPLGTEETLEGTVDVEVDGRTVTMTVLLADQQPRVRTMLRRGSALSGLTALSCCRSTASMIHSWDQAPDDGNGLRYRIR